MPELINQGIYRKELMGDNKASLLSRLGMAMRQGKNKNETLLQELITRAKRLGIEVRTEKLLREVGYRARSGRCRLKGQELIIIYRYSPLGDQVDFLATELSERGRGSSSLPQSRVKTRPALPLDS